MSKSYSPSDALTSHAFWSRSALSQMGRPPFKADVKQYWSIHGHILSGRWQPVESWSFDFRSFIATVKWELDRLNREDGI